MKFGRKPKLTEHQRAEALRRLDNGSNGNGAGNGFMNPTMAHIPLAQVFLRTNRKGQRYLVGRIGNAKLVIVETGECSRGEEVWEVFLGQGPHASERAEALARELEEGAAR